MLISRHLFASLSAGCFLCLTTAAVCAQDIDVTTLSSSEGARFFATDSGPYSINAYSTIGDFNGDGRDDFALASPASDTPTTSVGGIVNVVLGPTDAMTEFQLGTFETDNSLGFRIKGDATSAEIGHWVAPAGDFNGDGFADFLVSSKHNEAYLILGRNGEIDNFSVADLSTAPTYGLTISGKPGNGVGPGAGVGDFNGDGLSDVLVSAPVDHSADTSGVVYLIFGKNNPGDINLASFQGNGVDGLKIRYPKTWNDFYAFPASKPCDFNGDGLMDIVMTGDQNLSGGHIPLMVIAGTTSGIHDYEFGPAMPEDIISVNVGSTLSPYGPVGSHGSAGDFNGDGFSDLYLGAMFENPIARTNAGMAFVLYGRPMTSGTIFLDFENPTEPGIQITGAHNDQIGRTFTPIGDIDNDGFDDMILSTERDFPGQTDTQAAVVIYGRPGESHTIDLASPLAPDSGFIVGGSEDGSIEPAYARAGDVDADGFADYLVNVDMPGIHGNYRDSYLIYGREKQAAVNDWALYGR